MNDFDQSFHEWRLEDHARRFAARWLGAFEAALTSRDSEKIGALFHDDCHWRDVLAFTWHFSSVEGREKVAARLVTEQLHTAAHGFHLPPGRKPPRKVRRVGIECIEAIFEFADREGRGAGIIRLSPTPGSGDDMKAWLISTTLEELTGHEEKIGDNRPTGAAYSRNFGGDNWADMRRKASAYDDREPAVLVIGGAQAGLSIAARLNQLGVDTLVVEKWPRIGDSWRKRYHSLALHNSVHLNHLPYLEFPPTFPKYIPKDMLGNWFEFYADAMEINCWTNTEFVGGSWDERRNAGPPGCGRLTEPSASSGPGILSSPTASAAIPFIPDLPGLEDFAGRSFTPRASRAARIGRGKRRSFSVQAAAPTISRSTCTAMA